MPSRVSPDTFPIAATATAPAYDFDPAPQSQNHAPEPGQQRLFNSPVSDPRVIPFDSLTTQAERESIRARVAEVSRPAPVKTARVEVRHARPRTAKLPNQRTLDFQGQEEVLAPAESNIICDAPVAPISLRVKAACIDGALVAIGYALASPLLILQSDSISRDKHVLPFVALVLVIIPVLYKLLWTLGGRDSFGMQRAGLRLVDFDGNPPSRERRYYRLFGSVLSFLAAGVGLIWAVVDQDKLTWHDHISATFPTLDFED